MSTSCWSGGCQYSVNWSVEGDEIIFEVRAQTAGWVCIGISNDQGMLVTNFPVTCFFLPPEQRRVGSMVRFKSAVALEP